MPSSTCQVICMPLHLCTGCRKKGLTAQCFSSIVMPSPRGRCWSGLGQDALPRLLAVQVNDQFLSSIALARVQGGLLGTEAVVCCLVPVVQSVLSMLLEFQGQCRWGASEWQVCIMTTPALVSRTS
eukprot:923386-Amphidinium_carterae.1